MKTILCPVDFSANARDAYVYSLNMAKVFNSKVILLHCYETPVVFTELPLGAIPLNAGELYDNAQKRLKKFVSGIRSTGFENIKKEMIVMQGLASARTIEIAQEKKADMIIMGARGVTGGIERILMGSNTIRVLRNAPCPVLTIPKGVRFKPFDKIVYATDLQDDNLLAANTLLPLAKKFKSEILFLNVDNRLLMNDESDYRKMRKKISSVIKYPKISGYVSTQLNVVHGIQEFVKKTKPACLAMYSRHRGIIGKLTGSGLTTKTALKVKIPLLALPENQG
jgi:nucleotide-binding universal stress UspA family protein